jgi:hypothetical protein
MKRLITICAVMVLFSMSYVRADFTLHGNEQLTVNSWHSEGFLYDTSQVFVVSGGTVTGLLAYDNSSVTISGGTVNTLESQGNSQVTISSGSAVTCRARGSSHITKSGGSSNALWALESGHVTMSGGSASAMFALDSGQITMSIGSLSSDLGAQHNGQITMTGGTVGGQVYAYNNSQVTISGGSVNGWMSVINGNIDWSGGTISQDLRLQETGSLTIHGSNFAIDGIPIGFGTIISTLGGAYESEPYRRLTGSLANGNIINNQFRIGNTAEMVLISEPTWLLLQNPNGGEVLGGLSIYTINWSSTGSGSVLIEYSTDNGNNWNTVNPPNVGNTGSYDWSVPLVASQECLIRISNAANPNVSDISDGVFEIYEPTISVLQPNGGESICSGLIYTIEWSSTGDISGVLVEYSTDNSNNWNTVSPPNVGNTGSYDWSVPLVASPECLIRISNAAEPSIYDVSDSTFEIYEPTISVLQPNGGEKIAVGTNYEVLWASDLPEGSVFIEYSPDSGENWQAVATTEDTGTYNWHIAGPESGDYLVRISDANGLPVSDTSDSCFAVYTCQEQIASDLNGDCIVDFKDFAIMASHWLEKGYVRIYSYTLDTLPNWAMQGQWGFGQPTGSGGTEYGNPDPTSGYTGTNVYGVNLNGDYTVAVGGPYCLTAGPFNCTQFYDIKLKFARWINTDEPSYVTSKVEISIDGTNWNTVWQNSNAITDSSWQIVEYDISETADNEPTVYFRWSYEILDSRAYPYSGWNIDDVELRGFPN